MERKTNKNLGKLNRAVADAAIAIQKMGHAKKRFKRDYEAGTALYECSECFGTVIVTASDYHSGSFSEGEPLTLNCKQINQQYEESQRLVREESA